MRKNILNFILRLEKKNSKLFDLMLACNELYIRLYFYLFRPPVSIAGYSRPFSIRGENFIVKTLDPDSLTQVHDFFKSSIDTRSGDFFVPHKVDPKSLSEVFKKRSYIPLGIYNGEAFIGYALVRLLFPRKASYAIFVADKWQGKGIGTAALTEQLKLINSLGFAPYSAVNKKNKRSLRMLEKIGIGLGEDIGDCFVVKDRK